MERVELKIYYTENDVTKLRCTVNKWKFQDTMMGEQFITFNITSETPIDFAVGDFCQFRGETYTLNYVPSVTQKARTKERQDSYTYESVKFESFQEELTRCIMLDITPTTGDYVAALGTNYTGSSRFQLFCGEATANGSTLTAVCALAAKMQANLDRMFPRNGWKIFVDTTTTYLNSAGDAVLVTHTEDKVLSFDNTTVAKALEEVHNTFDLDYCIRGRSIYIGYNLKNLTSDNDNETFAFGYGKGYPTREDQNKALFQIKRIANSQQKVVTRLRALGSTKNMPYRYYNSKYNLSQSLFPTNLQLPDTFATPAEKAANNALRDSTLRAVKGDTNDAYIDKNDDAEHCAEGIREDSARWDGTNGDLPEIYPTIEEATYGELRSALVQDQDGQTGSSSFPNYGSTERIDKMLAIGYKDGNTLVDDANKGDGILPESGISARGIPRPANIGMTYLTYNPQNRGDFSSRGSVYAGPEKTLFTIQGVSAGKYAMAPTIGAVLYGFSISCYRDGISADVGYIISVKQKNVQTGATTTIAYTSDYQSITRGDGILEMELPELPDVKNGANAKVSEIRVTALSDITVTFTPVMRNINVPSGFTDNFSLAYKVGNSRLDHSVTYDPEYNWIPLDDSGSVSETFHVFIQDMGFDLQACWTDETPVVAMKSGRCVGREFEIGENIEKVTHNGKKGYMLTLKRATDNTLNTYYPSATDPIAAGDYFVLLNISMPDVYVKMAEVRLLRAATEYLADNCETQFTYQPSIDDIYLQRNYDNMVKAGTPQASIFWRLYAGLKFTFRGIPASEDSPAPLADITIEQVTISMGESLTPKVELKLNDDVQQSTIQKLTTSVDRIYNGSIFSSGSGASGGGGAMSAAVLSILQSEGEKLFLSKKHDDVAEGKITFNDVVTHNETLKAKKGLKVGNFNSRLLGSGALIDEEGNAEFESIYSRNFISTPEFRFNRVNVTEGEQWCTNGYGTIKEVEIIDETTGYITLKLEENDYASIAEGDICRGIYNDVAHEYQTASLDDDTELYAGENEGNVEGFGFSSKEGFFTSYFWVRQMITNTKGECKFLYELRNTQTPHPCEFMKFAQYGSFTNSERRSSSYETSIGHYYEMVLDGVSTWKIKSANVVYRKGYLGNMTVTLKTGKEAELQGYGLYVQDNVYFGNAVVQLDPETIADLQDALTSYSVDFSGYVDVVTVDDVGNVIGGLWALSGENNEYRSYRIHSAITVRKSGDLLVIAADDADAGEGTYKIYAQPKGCTCIIENSTIYITGISNIKDGVAGSADDANFDYAAMRAMDSCSVDIIVDCEGKGSIVKNFPIRIKHDSQPFVGADISNEFSAVSWNTQTQRYIGLPIVFDMKMWHNNEPLDIASVNDISVSPAIDNMTVVKSIITNASGAKVARITIAELPANLGLVTDLNVTCVATYSGVQYERTLVHTINKTTDTNVYQLLPSVSEVGVVYNDNKQKVVNTDKVYCTVRCDSTDDKHYTVATSDYVTHGLFITYQTFSLNSSGVEVGGEESAYSSLNGVAVSTDLTRIRFKLYKLRDTTLETLAELLAASNVIEVLDTEDVPVVLDGLDGDNSIFVSLDNQNDAVMCLEDGTVIASTLPQAKARLMDGEDTVDRSLLGITLAANKQTLGNWSLVCHGCTAEFVGWVEDSDTNDWVQIKVTGVSEDVASVDVNCKHTSHGVTGNYVSILSIKKIYGLDKYELTFDPPLVSYNPNTDTYTPESFKVYVWKTTQEEDRHLMTSLPGNTANAVSESDGSIRLQYSVDKGVSWTTLYGYASGKSIAKTLFDIDGVESVDFRLQKYVVGESGGEWVLLDEEGVEIVGDGENTIQLIIDNGNDTVMCLEDGTVIASTLPFAKVYLNDGNNMVNTDLAASAWQTLECVGCTAEWVSGYQSDGGKRFNVTAVTADVARVTAKVSYKGKTHLVVHTIKKLFGLDKYEIITDPVSIAYNPNTGLHTPTSFNVYVYLTTQDEDRHLMQTLPTHSTATDGDVILQYSVDDGSTWNDLTDYSSGKTVGRTLFSSVVSGAVLLRLQKYVVGESGGEWVLLDEEGVEITRSGLDGKGVEYIFITKNDWDGTDANKPTINDVASERQVDNYCPYTDAQHTDQWTDEPSGIGINQKYEFYAQRKKVNGVWQPFGDVKLWDKYALDGQSPYMIDLTNEQSFVNCSEDGTVISSYETSNLMIFKGNSYAFTDFNILITPTNVSCNGNASAFSLTDAQKTTAQSNGYFTLTPSALTANSGTISIQATLKTNTSIVLVAVYKVNKNIAGKNGVIYSLQPSLNVIHKNNEGTFTDTSLYIQVKKTVGSASTILSTYEDLSDEGLTIDYQNSTGTTTFVGITGAVSVASSNFVGGTNGTYGILRLKDSSGTIIDTERINVVLDGDDGVAYIIDASPESVTIPTDANSATWSGIIKFYKNIGGETSPIALFSRIYVRKLDGTRRYVDGGHSFYGYGDTSNPYTVSVTADDDVIEVYCIEEANSNDLLTDYIVKKEIAIYKNGDTGPEGEDAVVYYLTSDINSIIRNQYGDYVGSARPTITAWKKVGDNDAVRLNDITTPSVAEGFTINAYEMNGDTVAYSGNTSTTGILTCAEPYSYVDRFEVELVKSGKTYVTMSIPIITEQQGEAGTDGVFPRDCGLFDPDIATNQTYGYAGYIYRKVGDLVIRDMVRYEIGGVMYGFQVKTKSQSALITAAPTSASGDSNWESTGIVRTIIANTIFGTNANIGGFMASNQRLVSSNIAYRIVYKGKYSSSVTYGTTIESNIYVRQMVLYSGSYWVVRGNVASFHGQTPSENSEYWRKATSKELEIEKTLDSYVDILSFTVDGIQNIIEMIAHDDTTWSVDSDGRQTLGLIEGQRVVLDPISREVDIYDIDGTLSITLSGDIYNGIEYLFGNNSGSFTLTNATGSRSASNGGSMVINNTTNGTAVVGSLQQTQDGVISEFETTSTSRVTIVGTLRAKAGKTPYVSPYVNTGNSSAKPYESAPVTFDGYVTHHAYIAMYVRTYSDAAHTICISNRMVGSAISNGNGTVTTSVNRQVDVPAGYQQIVVVYENTVYTTNTTTSTETYWNVTSASYVSEMWLSRLFANGLAYGSSQNNFFALLNVASKIIMQAVTTDGSMNKHGFALDADGFKVQRKNITGKVFPTIYYGLISWTAKETFSISPYYSFDGNSPTLSRVASGADGQLKLTFPASWSSLNLGFSTAIINLVGYNDSCRNVHVVSFNSSQITIEGNDDTTNNYTSFAIEIKYIG